VCTPERIQRLGPGGREWIEPDEGARLEIRNAGTPDASGRASGLVYRYSGGFWQPDLAGVRRHDVVAEEQWEVTVGQGAHRLERLRDEAGPYLRFHAEADTQWMFLVGRLPKDLPDGAPVTVRSQVRCPAGAVCKTVLIQQDPKRGRVDLEHAGEPAGAWETHALLGRIRHRTDGDYYAVGRQNLKRGDWFDVREAGLLEGFIPPVQPAPPPAPGRPAL
jgi:hypothetical protein